jgi:hypothetical protein
MKFKSWEQATTDAEVEETEPCKPRKWRNCWVCMSSRISSGFASNQCKAELLVLDDPLRHWRKDKSEAAL